MHIVHILVGLSVVLSGLLVRPIEAAEEGTTDKVFTDPTTLGTLQTDKTKFNIEEFLVHYFTHLESCNGS